METNEKMCFVISPIGTKDSETRKRADQILNGLIRPALKECGYGAKRADEISEPGFITTQIIQHIIEDPIVIADLTERNANVFYELALRHAIKKPVVHIIDKGESIPFDVAPLRIIQIDTKDLVSVSEAIEEIKRQIKAAESPDFVVDTPISIAVELKGLLTSDMPANKKLADLYDLYLGQTSLLRDDLGKLGEKLAISAQDFIVASHRHQDILSVREEKFENNFKLAYEGLKNISLQIEGTFENLDKDIRDILRRFENLYENLHNIIKTSSDQTTKGIKS